MRRDDAQGRYLHRLKIGRSTVRSRLWRFAFQSAQFDAANLLVLPFVFGRDPPA